MEIFGHYQRARLILFVSMAVCFCLFWWSGDVFGVPAHRHLEVSLLEQPSILASLLVVIVVLAVCTLIGTLIAGTLRFEAGLFAACCGLSALSMRGGTMGDLLRQQNGALGASAGVFWILIFELILLYAFLAGAWAILCGLQSRGWLQPNSFRDEIEPADYPMSDKIIALVTQAAVMAICLFILLQTDAKKQVITSVGISALVGSLVAHMAFPVQPSPWFWGGPLLVGIVGYLLGYFSSSAWQIGDMSQPLARAMPLDYVSAGPAGAILGYWMARKWQRARELESMEETEPA